MEDVNEPILLPVLVFSSRIRYCESITMGNAGSRVENDDISEDGTYLGSDLSPIVLLPVVRLAAVDDDESIENADAQSFL